MALIVIHIVIIIIHPTLPKLGQMGITTRTRATIITATKTVIGRERITEIETGVEIEIIIEIGVEIQVEIGKGGTVIEIEKGGIATEIGKGETVTEITTETGGITETKTTTTIETETIIETTTRITTRITIRIERIKKKTRTPKLISMLNWLFFYVIIIAVHGLITHVAPIHPIFSINYSSSINLNLINLGLTLWMMMKR